MATKTASQVNAALAATSSKYAGTDHGRTVSTTPPPSSVPNGTVQNVGGVPTSGGGWIDPIRAPGDTKGQARTGQDALNPTQPTSAGTPQDQSYQQAQNNLNQGGLSGNLLQQAQTNLAQKYNQPTPTAPVAVSAAASTPTENKYQAGLNNALASGTPAPQSGGTPTGAVSSYMPSSQQDMSGANQIFDTDPVINTLMQGVSQLMSSQNQTTSLMSDYKKLYKSSGLEDINQELIDADTVINGTEDDIRNEIQSAGGMGTESQVQAMTLARNKNLIKRYNQLTQMQTNAQNQLNTLMNIDSQDKQAAQQRLNTNITNMFQMANFRQTALNNTRSQYQWLAQTMGADGLYNSLAKDPRQLSYAENIMGLAPGGLQEVAQQAAKQRALDTAEKQASINASRASTSAAYSNIAKNQFDMQSTAQKAAAAGVEGARNAGTVLGAVNTALGQVSATTTGLLGRINALQQGGSANNLQATLKTIKSNLAFSELQKMRQNSPTGGSLGQISDKEEELLSSTVANLSTSQSPEQLRTNLQKVQSYYVDYLGTIGYAVAPDGTIHPLTQ